jgi:hypothetical protein
VLTAVNSVGIVVITIAALAAGLVLAYNKLKLFHDAVNTAFVMLKARVTVAGVSVGGGYAVSVMSVGGDAIVRGIIVAVDYDVAQELARCAGVPTVSHVPQTLCCGQQGR